MSATQRSTGWYLGFSAYWFATSFKWFVLLVAVLAAQARAIVEAEAQKAAAAAGFPNLEVAEAVRRYGEGANTAWGMVFGIGAIWAIFGPSLFGWLSDRTGRRGRERRIFISLGAALSVIALMILAGANSILVLIVGYLLLQVSDDVGTGPYSALIPEMIPEDQRGRASGLMGIMQLAAQIGSAVLGFILKKPELIYIGIAVVNAICAIWTVRALRSAPELLEPEAPASTESFFKGWLTPWRSADFRWVWFTRFLNALGFYLIQPYLQNYLVDQVAAPTASGGRPTAENATFTLFGLVLTGGTMGSLAIALTISLFGAAGAAWAAKVTDRIGRKKVIYISGGVMGSILIPFALVPNYSVIWVLATVFGFGYGAYLSADWALVSDVLPNKAEAGKDMGVWQSSVSSVQVFTGAAGRAIDAGNAATPGLGYTLAILTAALAFLVSTFLVRNVKGST